MIKVKYLRPDYTERALDGIMMKLHPSYFSSFLLLRVQSPENPFLKS